MIASLPTQVSVVIAMFNEAENVEGTVRAVATVLETSGLNWEVLLVDDGSTDETAHVAEALSWRDDRIRIISYFPNQGRGKAIRTGFEKARGRIIATIDSDLSYDPKFILDLVKTFSEKPEAGVVIGSPYMKGGRTEGVPFLRLWVSRFGNLLLGFALPGNLRTTTGILRAYRREVLEVLELESNGKELYLEILSKVLALGYPVYEVPAILRVRKKGRSKFKLRNTASSHFIFSIYERPMMVFGLLGLLLLGLGAISGLYITYLRFKHFLNPTRPLVALTILLLLGGIGILSFGFIAIQLAMLRKELYKVQKQNRMLTWRLESLSGRPRSFPIEPMEGETLGDRRREVIQ